MLDRKWVLGVVVVCGALVAELADARTLSCGRHMIQRGDSTYQVSQRCPAPFWIERWNAPYVAGGTQRSPIYATDAVDIWYLNFGERRFMRKLTFRNGYLQRVDELRYGVGFEPGSRSCSPQALRNAGETSGEIWARCGEPAHRQAFPVVSGGYYGGPPEQHYHQEIWTYDFGSRGNARELTFANGRLVSMRVLTR